MKILIQSKTIEVTQALRAFIERQCQRLSKSSGQINSVTVFLESVSKKKNDLRAAVAKFKIVIPGKKEVIVERRSNNLYEAIADVSHRAWRYMRKSKERSLNQKQFAKAKEFTTQLSFST